MSFHNKFRIKQFKKGFTLIELLVVITILGILAGLTLATFGGTQARGRDSVRKTDLDAIKKTLELARQDSAGGYYYPELLSDLVPDYIKELPQDPKENTDYTYLPLTSTDGVCSGASSCTQYTIYACLENSRDSDRDSAKTGGVNLCQSPLESYTTSLN